jgi:hypothetical protein
MTVSTGRKAKSGFGFENQGFKVEVRGKVASKDDDHARIGWRGAELKRIDGPGEIGQVPCDMKFDFTLPP